MADAPRPTNRDTLRRLSQVAAVASGHRVEDTLDWLLPMLAYYSPGKLSSADDWFEEIKSSYGVEVPLHDIGESLSRLRKQGTLTWDSFNTRFDLAASAMETIEQRIESAADLETQNFGKSHYRLRCASHWVVARGGKF
jgi:hypothetical protein